MNKQLVTILAVIILLIGGSFAYLLTQDETDSPSNNNATITERQTPNDSRTASSDNRYVDYEEGSVATTEGTKVLFFHAPWCPQCRTLEASIEASTIPDDVTIFKVDYDSNQALRQKYGVSIQTTLVTVDDQGELVEKYVAYDEPTFAAVEENLLR